MLFNPDLTSYLPFTDPSTFRLLNHKHVMQRQYSIQFDHKEHLPLSPHTLSHATHNSAQTARTAQTKLTHLHCHSRINPLHAACCAAQLLHFHAHNVAFGHGPYLHDWYSIEDITVIWTLIIVCLLVSSYYVVTTATTQQLFTDSLLEVCVAKFIETWLLEFL
jgi:hypothetical protein